MNDNNPNQSQQPLAQADNSLQSPASNPTPTPVEQPITPVNPNEQQNTNKDINIPQKEQKKSGFPIKTFLLIIILAAIAAILIYIALNQKPPEEQAEIPNEAVTPTLENPVQTTLSISSTPIKLSTQSAYYTDITINTGQNAVNKVQLELLFDPKLLTNVSIENGKFFTDPQIFLKNIDTVNGRITFAIGTTKGSEGILGQGVIARLNFSAYQKQATTSVTLLPKTQVTADGYSESVLKTTIDALFNLNETPFKATTSGK